MINMLLFPQLLSWNPLDVRQPEFETMGWFSTLVHYGTEEGQAPVRNERTL